MNNQPGYVSLPASWRAEPQKKTVIVINGVTVPAVPAGSCLLLLVGLIMWMVGMLTARSTVDAIFSDLGLEAESLDHLKVTVLVSVILLSLLTLVSLVANAWLEAQRVTGTESPGQAYTLSAYTTNAWKLNVANWVLLLLVAFAMAGSITWLTTMNAALSATKESGGYGAAAAPAAISATGMVLPADVHGSSSEPATPPSSKTLTQKAVAKGVRSVGKGADVPDMGQVWSSYTACPPGCVDLGLIAQVLGLPWPCFCQVWLLGDLKEQLQKVVAQLWVAVIGALLLFVATSWLYGYLSAQEAHAARDLQEVMKTPQGQHSQLPGGV